MWVIHVGHFTNTQMTLQRTRPARQRKVQITWFGSRPFDTYTGPAVTMETIDMALDSSIGDYGARSRREKTVSSDAKIEGSLWTTVRIDTMAPERCQRPDWRCWKEHPRQRKRH